MCKDSVCELNLQFATRSAKESGNDIHHNSLMTISAPFKNLVSIMKNDTNVSRIPSIHIQALSIFPTNIIFYSDKRLTPAIESHSRPMIYFLTNVIGMTYG